MSKPQRKVKKKPQSKSIHLDESAVIRAELRRVRLKAGLSQAKLAEAFGRLQSFVSTVERGSVRADLTQIRKWLAACGTTLAEFVDALEQRLKPATVEKGLASGPKPAKRRKR